MQNIPLAERIRPRKLSEVIGQKHLIGDKGTLKTAINKKLIPSMILWGPPGVGKTTLSNLIAQELDRPFYTLSAINSGVKDVREIIHKASSLGLFGKDIPILFIDEIHRFSKAQQDSLLGAVEKGIITLIGATTENPSFEINASLLSRSRVYILDKLSSEDLSTIASKALKNQDILLDDDGSLALIIDSSDGDARRLINIIEQLTETSNKTLNRDDIAKTLQEKVSSFDKGGDIYYQQLSAFHKSVRGSSPDGALYWMARMIVSGCDPKVIARRLLAIASEDIGNADPRALQITINAWDVYERLGDKEGNRAIAQAAVFCACAPKSNAVYSAFNQAIEAAKNTGDLAVPTHLRNASTKLMEELGHGKGYRYAHHEPDGFSKGQTYFPKEMGEQIYYEPTDRGLEIKIKEKLKQLRSNL